MIIAFAQMAHKALGRCKRSVVMYPSRVSHFMFDFGLLQGFCKRTGRFDHCARSLSLFLLLLLSLCTCSHPSFLSLSSQKTPKRKRAVDYKGEANDETDGTPAKKRKAGKKGKNLLFSFFSSPLPSLQVKSHCFEIVIFSLQR